MSRILLKSASAWRCTLLIFAATLFMGLAPTAPLRLEYRLSAQEAEILVHAREVRTVLHDLGDGQTSKEETLKHSELVQNLKIAPDATGLEAATYTLESRLIREDKSPGAKAARVKPLLTRQVDRQGRSKQVANLENFISEPLAIIFPDTELSKGAEWSNVQTVTFGDSPELTLLLKYRLEDQKYLAGKNVALIRYQVQGELKTSELTDNPALLQKIQALRARGIEKIQVSGSGTVHFNLNERIPLLHVTELSVEISERLLSAERRELRDTLYELHRAEVLKPL